MVRAPYPDAHAQGVEGQAPLVVGQLTELRGHRSAPGLEIGQPTPRRPPGVPLGEHGVALGLQRLLALARLSELLSHFLSRVQVEQPEMTDEIAPFRLDQGDVPVDGRKIVFDGILVLKPL